VIIDIDHYRQLHDGLPTTRQDLRFDRKTEKACKLLVCKPCAVGVKGFEPSTSWSRTKRSKPS
jgi:hypothetical protein